jgi:hypothetical protein
MNDHFNKPVEDLGPRPAVNEPVQDLSTPPAEVQGTEARENGSAPRWHAEAGRKGARRIHQLMEEGKLYEQEHGLKRGRQRLRQLIEEGKLYEQEHGLRPAGDRTRGERRPRLSSDEALSQLLRSLLRLVKPVHRRRLAELLQSLQPGEQAAS